MGSSRSQIGRQGEQLAAQYCRNLGYQIIDQNWRCKYPRGEVDIIAKHQDTLVFIEVKTGEIDDGFLPENHLTPDKLRRLAKLAFSYLNATRQTQSSYRVDLMAITLGGARPDIRHYENAVTDTY